MVLSTRPSPSRARVVVWSQNTPIDARSGGVSMQGGVNRDNTLRQIAKEGTQPKNDNAGDQDGLTGGLDAVEVPAGGLGAK